MAQVGVQKEVSKVLSVNVNNMYLQLGEVGSSISGSYSAYFCIFIRNSSGYWRGLALGYHSNKVYLTGGPNSTSWQLIS